MTIWMYTYTLTVLPDERLNDTLALFTESPLFGVQLSTLLENDQKMKTNTTVPLFLQTVRGQNTYDVNRLFSCLF